MITPGFVAPTCNDTQVPSFAGRSKLDEFDDGDAVPPAPGPGSLPTSVSAAPTSGARR